MLTDRQKRFVFEYCKDFIATKAYIRAGYSEGGAGQAADKLLKNTEVLDAIEEQKEMLASVATLSPAWVLHQWMQIASANPNDLVKVTVECCSQCWVIEDGRLPPNPDCTSCRGKGVSYVTITDTRTLSGAARRLYAGAVQTKDGIKVLMRDQDAALANLSRYLGMVVERKELSGPGGGPVPIAAVSASDLTDDQLAALASAGSSPLALNDGNMGVSAGVSHGAAIPTTIDAVT
jgi:phage terminase small subunit